MRLVMFKSSWFRVINLHCEQACYWVGSRIQDGVWFTADYNSTLRHLRGDTLFNFGDEGE